MTRRRIDLPRATIARCIMSGAVLRKVSAPSARFENLDLSGLTGSAPAVVRLHTVAEDE